MSALGGSGWFGRRKPRQTRVVRPDVAAWERRGGWDGGAPALRLAPQSARVEIPWPFTVTLAVLRGVAKGVRWTAVMTFLYPFTVALGLLAVVIAAHRAFVPAGTVLAVLLVAGLVVAWLWPHRFSAHLVMPVRRYRLRRRLARSWAELVRFCNLVVVDHDHATGVRTAHTPRLTRLRWSGPAKAVLAGQVRIVAGQVVGDLSDRAEKLASAAGATWCRVEATGPNTATVRFLYGDPLAGTVQAPRLPAPDPSVGDGVELSAVPVGMTETGDLWTLKLTGAAHLLIAGSTGAGKSSLVWALLRGVAPAIASGRVQVWGIDGKRGIELACARLMLTRFASTAHDALDLLASAVQAAEQRADLMAGHSRQHEATLESPHVIVLVDEIARLTAYNPDRKQRERAITALSVLTTQGRALGFTVIGTVQDPRADVTSIRHLFPVRVGMRLDSASETAMVLGDAAVENGAACHTIPEHAAGVAFVKIDGRREPQRVRAAYLSDDDVRHLAETHPAPVRVHPNGHPYLDETTPTREPVWQDGAPTDPAPSQPAPSDPADPAEPARPVEPGHGVPGVPEPRKANQPAVTDEQLAELRRLMEGGAA